MCVISHVCIWGLWFSVLYTISFLSVDVTVKYFLCISMYPMMEVAVYNIKKQAFTTGDFFHLNAAEKLMGKMVMALVKCHQSVSLQERK